jgi:hypothetical protein
MSFQEFLNTSPMKAIILLFMFASYLYMIGIKKTRSDDLLDAFIPVVFGVVLLSNLTRASLFESVSFAIAIFLFSVASDNFKKFLAKRCNAKKFLHQKKDENGKKRE